MTRIFKKGDVRRKRPTKEKGLSEKRSPSHEIHEITLLRHKIGAMEHTPVTEERVRRFRHLGITTVYGSPIRTNSELEVKTRG